MLILIKATHAEMDDMQMTPNELAAVVFENLNDGVQFNEKKTDLAGFDVELKNEYVVNAQLLRRSNRPWRDSGQTIFRDRRTASPRFCQDDFSVLGSGHRLDVTSRIHGFWPQADAFS